MNKPDISIIIVNFKTKKEIKKCIQSINKSQKPPSFEIILIDNETKSNQNFFTSLHSKLRYFHSSKNIGFSRANNLGAKHSHGKYLFFLNPDTQVFPDTLSGLVSELKKQKKSSILAPTLLDSDHKPYPKQGTAALNPLRAIFSLSLIHKLFPNNPIAKNYWLKQIDRSVPFKADVIPGTAFMIKKTDFLDLGGFDPGFFLFFEEFDLCKRFRESGGECLITPHAKLVHAWGGSTQKVAQSQVDKYFSQSRFYYFKKHYGFLKAILVQAVTSINAADTLFALILMLAAFLRFHQLNTHMPFLGDYGRDFLAARDAILNHQLPLLGIPSSVPRFSQGPLYVWFVAFTFLIFGFHPANPAFMSSTLGLLAVGFTYILTKKHLGKIAALTSSFFLATSPLAIIHSRSPYHTNAIPLFSLLFLYFLVLPKKKLNPFLLGLTFALLFQFELVAAPLFLLVLLVITNPQLTFSPVKNLKSKAIPFKKILHSIVGALVGLIPQIIFDLTHNFKQLGLFIVWTGYRVSSFFGIYSQEHLANPDKFQNLLKSFYTYLGRFVHWEHKYLIFVLLTLSAISFTISSQKPKLVRLTLAWIMIMPIAYTVIGNASEAYFPIFFVPLSILLGWSISGLPRLFKFVSILLLIFLGIQNTHFFLSHNLLMASSHRSGYKSYGPPLSDQIKAMTYLSQKNLPVNLISIEPGSQHQSHLDNYRYLYWWLSGNQTSQSGIPVLVFNQSNPRVPPNFIKYKFNTLTIAVSIRNP